MNLIQHIRLYFRPGLQLGRLHITPLAKATISNRDHFAVLALHKEGPWDGFGKQWHDCSGSYPVQLDDEPWQGRALYSGGYSEVGPMMLVRTAPDGQSTIVMLAEEEGCEGWRHCAVCRANSNRFNEMVFQALKTENM